MNRRLRDVLLACVCLALTPALAHAQASISGTVKDTSGAVLPGVTVEAASPALIEKVRSAVTDGTGQYRIENLRPGIYKVTFTLPGFAVVEREGLELAGAFTATVNADLRVGTLEETITVSGETPVVDVQSTLRQRVMSREVLDTIPAARTAVDIAVLIPGTSAAAGQNVGGLTDRGSGGGGNVTIHGGGSAATTIGGVSIAVMPASAATTTLRPNPAAFQEIVVDTSAVSADLEGGGLRINYIPRDGGNIFTGTFFASLANDAMQGSNFTQDLKDRGLRSPNALKTQWDVNPGFGGPLQRDRLWFFVSGRYNRTSEYAAGMFYNRNTNNPNAWTFDPDPARPVTNDAQQPDGMARLTWQATQKHKIGLMWNQATQCFCPVNASANLALEAASRRDYPRQQLIQADWTAPLTSRLLFEAGGNYFNGTNDDVPLPGLNPAMISVTEQSNGLTYRAASTYRLLPEKMTNLRGSVSYITGAHAFKVGFNHREGRTEFYRFANQPVSYRFNNGVPNQLTEFAYPWTRKAKMDHSLGLFAQDKWTVGGLTLSYGARYDYAATSLPEQHVGPAVLAPTRNITFPAQKSVAYHDVSPKFGVSYDPFGMGKTALKASLNRYVTTVPIDGDGDRELVNNPVNNLVSSTNRSWTDADRDFVPDCDLLNTAANGECGAMDNSSFGGTRLGASFDPDLLRGWGRRGYDWEFSMGLQQELLPRVSADVSYFRRWFGNFSVIDNLAVAPSDFDPFSITAPVDPRLPGGGGYVVSGLYNLNPAKFGVPADNFVTRADNYGKQVQYWQGVDATINARPLRPALLFQGGVSTGRRVTDRCEIVAKLDNPSPLYCRVVEAFSTQLKFLGSYTIPRLDVQISGSLQNIPGPEIAANYNAANAEVVPSLGRNLAGGARNVTVNLVAPGTMYGERLTQIDLRISKLLQFGAARVRANVDLYNALNSDAVLALNNSFGAWQQPTRIVPARFVKLSMQLDF
jgi:hypothetical protein